MGKTVLLDYLAGRASGGAGCGRTRRPLACTRYIRPIARKDSVSVPGLRQIWLVRIGFPHGRRLPRRGEKDLALCGGLACRGRGDHLGQAGAMNSASVFGLRLGGDSHAGPGGSTAARQGERERSSGSSIVIGRFGFPSGRRGRFAGAAAYSSAHSRSVNRAASAGSCDQAASPVPLLAAGSYQTSQAPVMPPASRPSARLRQATGAVALHVLSECALAG